MYASNVYFAALFTTELKERNEPEITLTGVDGGVLQQLVEYCYSGVITIDTENIDKMTHAATMLQFSWVQEICAQFYSTILNATNCLWIREIAELHNLVLLKEEAHAFVLDHFGEVAKSDEFLQLSCADLSDLLKNDEVNVASEQDVLSAVIRWISYDVDKRKGWLGVLLEYVRFKHVSDSVSNKFYVSFMFDNKCL